MRSRLPRKEKKRVKKIVARKAVERIATIALIQAQAVARTAIIMGTPFQTAVSKSLSIAQSFIETAIATQKIMSEKPAHWRDYVI